LALKEGRDVRMLSRQGRDMAVSFPEIVADLHNLRGTVAIDGEIAVLDPRGLPQFEKLSRRALTRLPISVEAAAKRDPAAFFVFDLLWSHGKDQRKRSLLERKALLSKLVSKSQRIQYCQHVSEGTDLYDFTVRMGLEGVLAKRPTSPYVAGRSHYWQKSKTPIEQERERNRFDRS
jgi:bifunctional non-homologous end joining protein LigD